MVRLRRQLELLQTNAWVRMAYLLGALVLLAIVQRLMTPTRAMQGRAAAPVSAYFLVCLVGRSLDDCLQTAEIFSQRASNPRGVHFAIVVAVSSAREVLRKEEVDERSNGLAVAVTWRHATDPSTFLTRGRRIALQKLYQGESLILLANGCDPRARWDAACLEFLTGPTHVTSKKNASTTLITACASDDGEARFPRLSLSSKDGQVRVRSRRFETQASECTPSTLCTQTFCCAPAHLMQRTPLEDSQLDQTSRLREMGVRIKVPSVAMCTVGSRHGVRTPVASNVRITTHGFGKYPSLGLVDETEREMVLKYGSVDAARVHISKLTCA